MPPIGVVVVHHGADDLTMRCLRALVGDEQSPPTVVVLVENGPGASFAAQVRAELPAVTVVGAGANLGFAAGCNLGIAAVPDVDLVALVNSDVLVSPGWFRPLTAALDADPRAAAACPKILFEGSFHTLRIEARSTVRPGWGDRRALAWQLRCVRVDGADVTSRCQLVSGFWEPDREGIWAGPVVELRVPAGEHARVHLELEVPMPGQELVVEPGGQVVRPAATGGTVVLDLLGEPVRVINNVGSEWRADGYGVDLGYQEVDRGQHDLTREVPAWCGGAVLLRRSYLEQTGGFDERLFLYYEDLELSIRGAAMGWRYRLEPASVVEHRHAASFSADPAGISARRERNRLAVLVRHGRPAQVATAVVTFVFVTASYLRRDVLARVARRRRPAWGTVVHRVRALVGAGALAPAMLRSRRADRRGREDRHWLDC